MEALPQPFAPLSYNLLLNKVSLLVGVDLKEVRDMNPWSCSDWFGWEENWTFWRGDDGLSYWTFDIYFCCLMFSVLFLFCWDSGRFSFTVKKRLKTKFQLFSQTAVFTSHLNL